MRTYSTIQASVLSVDAGAKTGGRPRSVGVEEKMSEDKRKAGRRNQTRRVADFLCDELSKEDIQAFDRVAYRSFLLIDRRNTVRRSGKDRRMV